MKNHELEQLRQQVAELEQRFITSEKRRSQDTPAPCPQPKPLTILHWVWRRVSPDDRIRFLTEMLTPNERRALQFGFEEDLP